VGRYRRVKILLDHFLYIHLLNLKLNKYLIDLKINFSFNNVHVRNVQYRFVTRDKNIRALISKHCTLTFTIFLFINEMWVCKILKLKNTHMIS